jgi:Tetratricopeptide repeat/Putative zinc-finger
MTCATYANDSDAAERYVLGEMGEAEQASFEEHYFGCDACFASVQTLQQMQTALRGAPQEQLAGQTAAPAAAQAPPAQTAAAHTAAAQAPATVVNFPKRGFAGVDAKWWGLAVAATLLLTTMWWPRRGVDPAVDPSATVARNTDPLAPPASNPPPSNPPSSAQPSGVKPSDGQQGSKVPGDSGAAAGGAVKPPVSSPSTPPREPVQPSRGLEALAVVTPPPYVPLQTRGSANTLAQSFASAMTRYSAKDYAGAAEQLQPLAESSPDAAHVQFFLGISQLMSGKPAAAIESLDRAATTGTAPFADEAHFYLAKAAMQTRDLARAERELQIAVEREAGPVGEAADLLRDLKKLPR